MMMSRVFVAAGLAAGLAISLAGWPALAEDLSAKQIQERLTAPKTRSLTATPQLTSDDLAFVKRVRGQTRSLSLDDREQMAAIASQAAEGRSGNQLRLQFRGGDAEGRAAVEQPRQGADQH